jgi:RNA polymerase sigma-70 factor (ECF subfamily)
MLRMPLLGTSDENLLSSPKHRDREALTELFRRYSRLVFSIGLRVMQDEGEARRLCGKFLFLYQRAALFDERGAGGAKAWLVQAYHRASGRKEYLHRRNFYSGPDSKDLADTLAGRTTWNGS